MDKLDSGQHSTFDGKWFKWRYLRERRPLTVVNAARHYNRRGHARRGKRSSSPR
jgi:hypothetical protein